MEVHQQVEEFLTQRKILGWVWGQLKITGKLPSIIIDNSINQNPNEVRP